ncbi:MAG: hypothetical protein AB1452_18820, partial [Pseudomonadota bacterium]
MKSLKATLNTPPEPGFDEASLADTSLPDDGSIVRHPDGYYWIAPDGHQEFGPFATAEEALADMNAGSDEAPEPGETLQEAEQELGLADWVDA